MSTPIFTPKFSYAKTDENVMLQFSGTLEGLAGVNQSWIDATLVDQDHIQFHVKRAHTVGLYPGPSVYFIGHEKTSREGIFARMKELLTACDIDLELNEDAPEDFDPANPPSLQTLSYRVTPNSEFVRTDDDKELIFTISVFPAV